MNKKEKIAVLGGGHGAHAVSADLSLRGFSVVLYDQIRSNIEKVLETKKIEIFGDIENEGTAELEDVTTDIDKAIKDAKYILIVVPAFVHKLYAELLAGRLNEDQVLILMPGTFGSLELKEIFRRRGKDVGNVIAETNTLPYDTRLVGPAKAKVFACNPIKVAVFPSDLSKQTLDAMPELYPLKGTYSDVLECGLSSVNPTIHSGPCVINIGPIEYWVRNFYLYEEGFTPSAAKLDTELDRERKNIAKKLGYDITPLRDFSSELRDDWDWKDLYRVIHGEIGLTQIEGPNDINSRYLTEDGPYGLVTWSSIAKQIGVETPLMDSIVNIYCVVHERDWWKEGRTLKDLGLSGMSPKEMKDYVRTGKKNLR